MGIFITFEGPDGSGKTTVSTSVYNRLLEDGYNVIYTREPGGIDIAEQIRNVILDVKNTAMDPKTEALLYAASRRQHLVEKILPALEEGKIVICDRFLDSSLAYQGFARKIGVEDVYNINMFAIENHMPVKTIFLDVDAEIGLARIQDRANKDRLDVEELSFHNAVYEGYQRVIEQFKDRIIKVNANNEVDDVVEECYQAVLKVIND